MQQNICQRMPENSRSDIGVIEDRLLRNQAVDPCCEGEISKKVKGKAIFHVTTSLITKDGKPVGFQHCARDVTDERQLQENLSYYLQQVTRAQEEERKRIARELHDDILQRLIAMSRQLEKLISSDALWEESLQTVRDFKKQIELAIQEMRRFARDLRPSILDDLGLLPAIDLLSDELEQRGIVTSFRTIGEAKRLSPEVEVMLFRIAQEATTNIWRHAQASAAELVIQFGEGSVSLSIKDNGKGFGTPLKPGNMANSGKLGLAGMHERAKLLGGTLRLHSGPGRGTIVNVEVPA
jgi:signal transduction histidine kinase